MIRLIIKEYNFTTEVTVATFANMISNYLSENVGHYYGGVYLSHITDTISHESNQSEIIEQYIDLYNRMPNSNKVAAPELTKSKLKLAGYPVETVIGSIALPF